MVTRSVGVNHATVTLTATISKSGGASDTKIFTLTVKRNITGTTATRVYGQGGSFITNTLNQGGLSADSLQNPSGLAIDPNGGLYISDNANNRVLWY